MAANPSFPTPTAALVAALTLSACGPIVSAETSDGNGAAEGANAVGESSPDVVPPTVDCTPNVEQVCGCPGMTTGTRSCDANGEFGPCVCDPVATTTGFESTSSGERTETGSAESSSSSSTGEPFHPVPCRSTDDPCDGPIRLQTNEDVVQMAACSRVAGSLFIEAGVTDLTPLSCLRELGNQLYVEGVDMHSLAGLSNLEWVDGELEIGWTHLAALDLDALIYTGYFSLYLNEEMVTLGVPNLQLIDHGIDVTDNPQLPTCEVQWLADEVLGPDGSAYYAGNADDGCPSTR